MIRPGILTGPSTATASLGPLEASRARNEATLACEYQMLKGAYDDLAMLPTLNVTFIVYDWFGLLSVEEVWRWCGYLEDKDLLKDLG